MSQNSLSTTLDTFFCNYCVEVAILGLNILGALKYTEDVQVNMSQYAENIMLKSLRQFSTLHVNITSPHKYLIVNMAVTIPLDLHFFPISLG